MFYLLKWWFSIAMLVYQRVNGIMRLRLIIYKTGDQEILNNPINCPLTHPNLTSKNWKKNRMRRTKKSDEMYNYVQLDPINKYKLYSKAYISSPQSVRFLPISLPSLLRHVGQFALGRPCEKFAQALLAVRNEVLGTIDDFEPMMIHVFFHG